MLGSLPQQVKKTGREGRERGECQVAGPLRRLCKHPKTAAAWSGPPGGAFRNAPAFTLYSLGQSGQNDQPTSHSRGDVLFFAPAEKKRMTDRIPMTMAGYEKLKADLRRLETEEEPKLAARVAAARCEGDLSENAEYHGAPE